jgi:predicted flap endonuclease-1-like 5' DNA nuclease
MVDGMLPESVIVDMAASTGGNCELTRIGEHYYHNDTLIVGPLNLPSHGAVHASEMYSRNVYNMLQLIIADGQLMLNPEDEIIARCVLLHNGHVNHASTASLLEVEQVPFGQLDHAPAELPDQTAGWLDDESSLEEEQVEKAAHTATRSVSENPPAAALHASLAPASADVSASPDIDAHGQPGTAEKPVSDQAGVEQIDVRRDSEAELIDSDQVTDEEALRDLAELDGLDPDEIQRLAKNGDSGSDEEDELSRDELIRIDGVGPALQERLYSFGYRQFRQLAELDDDSIEKLAVQLELGDEIREQDWRGQAQRLMESGE